MNSDWGQLKSGEVRGFPQTRSRTTGSAQAPTSNLRAPCKVGSGCREDFCISLSLPGLLALSKASARDSTRRSSLIPCRGPIVPPDHMWTPVFGPRAVFLGSAPPLPGQSHRPGEKVGGSSPACHHRVTSLLTARLAGGAGAARRCQRDGISQATAMNQTFPINNQGEEGDTKRQAEATASVKANPIHSLILYSAAT